MLVLITGVPGSGKSLRAVWHIQRHLGEGRKVYSDIDELNIAGVESAPKDWRDTPEGSVLVYDEAQRLFGSDGRGGGRSSREDIQALETHRHTGHDIYFITQHPSLLHSHVRRLVGRHEHVMRIFGRGAAHVYWRDRCWEVDKSSERRTAVSEWWKYPADLFQCYKSATIHTNSKRIPRSLKVGAVVLAALIVGVGYSFSSSALFGGEFPEVENGHNSTKASPAKGRSEVEEISWLDRDWAEGKEMASVGGCISTATRCRCYTTAGKPLQLTNVECHKRVDEPLPYAIDILPVGERGGSEATESGAERSAEPASPDPRMLWN